MGILENKDKVDNVIALYGEEIDTGIVGKVAWWWLNRRSGGRAVAWLEREGEFVLI